MTIAEFKTQINSFLDRWYRWVTLVVVVGVLLLGWLVFLQHGYRDMRESDIGGYQATVERLQDRQTHLDQVRAMEKHYSELEQERLRHIDYVLPLHLDTTAMIADLSMFATAAGVHVMNIDVVRSADATASTAAAAASPATNADSIVRTAVITLNVQTPDGTYDQLKQLLVALETATPILDLEMLTYTPGNTSYALQLRTYYREDEAL